MLRFYVREYRRPDEISRSLRGPPDQQAALAFADGKILFDTGLGARVDHRSDLGARLHGIADVQTKNGFP